MTSSRSREEDDANKPVIGYPTAPEFTDHPNTCIGYPPVDSDNLRRPNFLRRVIISLVSGLVIFSALYFILSLVFQPDPPEFRVHVLTIPPVNSSTSAEYPVWKVGLLIKNPNKMHASYEDMEGGLFYGEESLCETAISPFFQEKKTEVYVLALFDSIEETSFSLISADRARGWLSLNFKISGWVRFDAGGWRTRYQLLNVFCKDLTVAFNSSTGVGSYHAGGGSDKCQVYVYR